MRVKEINDLIKELEKQGWKVTHRKKHFMAYPPDKTKSPVTIAASPSDHRAIKNLVAWCKERGAKL